MRPIKPADERRAGRYAQSRYEAGRREWRRRVGLRLGLYGALFATPTFIAATILHETTGFALGVVAGVSVGICLWVKDEPPEYVTNWLRGAEAEKRTAKALRRLADSGWCVLHDVPSKSGNIDHLVVGPAGVFVLETKAMRGEVTVEGDDLHVQRRLDPQASYVAPDVGRRMRGRAIAVSGALTSAGPSKIWVHAVVVLDEGFAAGVVEGNSVAFVAREQLADWLASRRVRLSPERVEQLAAVLRVQVARADAGDARRRVAKPATARADRAPTHAQPH